MRHDTADISFRIKITGPMEVQVSHPKQSEGKKVKKKWSEMFKFNSEEEKVSDDTEKSAELDGGVVGGDGGAADQEAEPVEEKPRILMVRTENLTHQPFQQTQELKVRIATWQHEGWVTD